MSNSMPPLRWDDKTQICFMNNLPVAILVAPRGRSKKWYGWFGFEGYISCFDTEAEARAGCEEAVRKAIYDPVNHDWTY